MSEIGHNSGDFEDEGDGAGVIVMNSSAKSQLMSFIERLERLEEEKAEIGEQIKEVKAEAKGNGFNVSVISELVKLRKKDRASVQEAKAILRLYAESIGCADLI